ncbi:MAG: hypothetical protein HRT57_05175, partial [Crocinitomicaceae bacterium]|nr:hypothetical protein [Crocinitomicaceae bacterium]
MKKSIITIIVTFFTTCICIGQEVLDYSGTVQNSVDIIKLKNSHHNAKKSRNAAIIINVIPSPNQSTNIQDIAFDGTYLWVEGVDEYFIHQISPVDGSIVKSIPTSVQKPYGLTFDGACLWLADNQNKIIQRIDTANGNVLQSFPTPVLPNNSYPGGLAWDGQNLWHNDMLLSANDSTYKLNATGQVIQSYQGFGTYSQGLTWDGQYLWSTDNPSREIYKIDVATFSVMDTINAPGGQYPNGLAFDGQYLWVANNDADSIYQIDVGLMPTGNFNLKPTQNKFTIYPNPTSGNFSVDLGETYNAVTISITD